MALLLLHGWELKEVVTETLKEDKLLSLCLLAFFICHVFFQCITKILYFKKHTFLPSPSFLLRLARCECHGHADHCDTSLTSYRCLCLPESHTEGNNVSKAPLMLLRWILAVWPDVHMYVVHMVASPPTSSLFCTAVLSSAHTRASAHLYKCSRQLGHYSVSSA